jgi:hypothetical protein
MTSHSITLVSEATPCKHSDDATELTGSVFRFTGSGYISEAVSRFSSVLRSSSTRELLSSSPRDEFIRSSPMSQLLSFSL